MSWAQTKNYLQIPKKNKHLYLDNFLGRHAERDLEELEIPERGQADKRLPELDRGQVVDDRIWYAMEKIDKRGQVWDHIDHEQSVGRDLLAARRLADQLGRGVVFIVGPEEKDPHGQLTQEEAERYNWQDYREVNLPGVLVRLCPLTAREKEGRLRGIISIVQAHDIIIVAAATAERVVQIVVHEPAVFLVVIVQTNLVHCKATLVFFPWMQTANGAEYAATAIFFTTSSTVFLACERLG